MSFIKFRNQFYVKKFSAFVDLPVQHCNNLTKLMSKLQQVEFGKTFKTMLDKQGKRFLFMRLDYNHAGVHFDRKLDSLDELILNSIYSFGFGVSTDNEGYYSLKEERPIFGARKILQHIFGNVADHFQEEIVKVVEERLEDMSYMKLTLDLRDNLGNSKSLTVRGEEYRPVAVKESLLDVSIVQFESTSKRRFQVYRLNRKSPVFTFAEKLGQITSWDTRCMAVPCQKTLQNAVIVSYLLTRISLVKNVKNHYVNNGILFNTLFEDLRLDVSTRMKKKVIRDNIRRMFDYWVQIGLLMSYKFVKVGQKFHKIVFKLNLMGGRKMLEDKIAYIHEHPEVYFTQEARKGGYICPVCENGTGSDGTGVKLIKGQSFRYKCFKCGTSGDVINFYAAEHHMTNAEAITEVLRMYGLETQEYDMAVAKTPPPKVKTVAEVADDLKVANMIATDIELGQENLRKATDNFFFQRRGISKEIVLRYGCGFIKNWVHPKLRTGMGDKKIVPSDRMIIPTGADSYVARAVDSKNRMPKLKAGKSNIFNLEVLKTSAQNVVVVEGEFDALSVIEAGNDAIALGTTTNVEKFLTWLKESGVRPKKPIVIDLDADEAGRTAARKLTAGLSKLRIRYYELTLVQEGCKDQNESLIKNRELFFFKVKNIPEQIVEQKREARRKLSDSAKVAKWEVSIANARDAIPTGWKSLDKALEGGLYEGLYVIPGATGTGKTAFALQMAYQIARQKKDVLYISLEMGEEEIYERHISRLSYELYGTTSRAKTVHSLIQEKKTVPEAREQFEKVGLYLRTICGVGSIDADDIRRVVERYEYELDTLPVVFVDYLQILKAHDPHMTDKQAVDYNVLRLKQLSRDYKIPVIALASMNRTSYSDVISMVSIKESGAIEYTSDVCIGLQMAAMDSIVDVSKKQGQQEKKVRKLKSKQNRDMQAVILKQRNGQIGAEIPFTYCAMFNHFGEDEFGGVPLGEFDCVPDI